MITVWIRFKTQNILVIVTRIFVVFVIVSQLWLIQKMTDAAMQAVQSSPKSLAILPTWPSEVGRASRGCIIIAHPREKRGSSSEQNSAQKKKSARCWLLLPENFVIKTLSLPTRTHEVQPVGCFVLNVVKSYVDPCTVSCRLHWHCGMMLERFFVNVFKHNSELLIS